MKNILILLLISLSLCACKSSVKDDTTNNAAQTQPATTQQPTTPSNIIKTTPKSPKYDNPTFY